MKYSESQVVGPSFCIEILPFTLRLLVYWKALTCSFLQMCLSWVAINFCSTTRLKFNLYQMQHSAESYNLFKCCLNCEDPGHFPIFAKNTQAVIMCPSECFSHLISIYPITTHAHWYRCFLWDLWDSCIMKVIFFPFIFNKGLGKI